MAENVKVNIDVSAGTVAVECPEAALEGILTRVAEFIPKLIAPRGAPTPRDGAQPPPQQRPTGPDESETGGAGKRAPKRKTSVYKMTELGADDDAKRSFKKFFEGKKPKSQNDQLLLCAFWVNKTLARDTFTDDDVFTALRAAGAPRIPTRIESVISNLKLENKLVGDRGKYKITHIGEDFVNNDLPPKAA